METDNSAKAYAEQLAAQFKFQNIGALEKAIAEGHDNFKWLSSAQNDAAKPHKGGANVKNVVWEKAGARLGDAINELIDLSNDESFFDELVEAEIDPELEQVISRLIDIRAMLVPHNGRGSPAVSPIRQWVFKLAKYWENEKGLATSYFLPADNGIKHPAKKQSCSQFIFTVIERFEPEYTKSVHHALSAYIERRKVS